MELGHLSLYVMFVCMYTNSSQSFECCIGKLGMATQWVHASRLSGSLLVGSVGHC